MAVWIAHNPFQQCLWPGVDPKGCKWLEFRFRRQSSQEAPFSERAHDHHTQTQICRLRKDDALYVPFLGIRGNLNGSDSSIFLTRFSTLFCIHDAYHIMYHEELTRN
jgi:hypothetical protein